MEDRFAGVSWDPSRPVIGVVIVNYNGGKFIDDCLESLLETDYQKTLVFMVDNASTDGSVEHVERNYPWVHVIRNSRNYLFARGANIGIRKALEEKVDYLFLLNPDVTVTPNCISRLAHFLDVAPDVGACQPKLLFRDKPDYIQSCGCRCSLSGRGWDYRMGEKDRPDLPAVEEVLGVTGGALFVRSTAWASTTGFWEPFGMYYEDIDFSIRLRIEGFNLACLNSAVAYHVFSGIVMQASSSKKYFFTERNCFWVVLRNFPVKKIFKSYLNSVPISLAMAGLNILKGRCVLGGCGLLGLVIGIFSLAVCLPFLLIAQLSKKRKYPFWNFIDETKILPPPPH